MSELIDADAPGDPTGHLSLVGLMGAGKTEVGARLAGALGRPFVDLDHEIEALTGHSIPDLFTIEGESGFRDIEQHALEAVLAAATPLVVATGGGAVLRWSNRELMRARGVVVWLRAEPRTLMARLGGGAGRPLLARDPEETVVRLAVERRNRYAAAAHRVVDVDDRTPGAIVTEIREEIMGGSRPS